MENRETQNPTLLTSPSTVLREKTESCKAILSYWESPIPLGLYWFPPLPSSKFTLNQYLKSFGIRVAESMLVNKQHEVSKDLVVEKIGLPCFIKPMPAAPASVTKVKTREQIRPALQRRFKESDDVMIEAFMDGIELANGCYKTKEKSVILPTEVVSQNEFFGTTPNIKEK